MAGYRLNIHSVYHLHLSLVRLVLHHEFDEKGGTMNKGQRSSAKRKGPPGLVAYLSLRVAVQQIKCERVRSLPPTRLGPLSIQTGHLNVNRHLGSLRTAETAHLPKLAPQFAVGAFQPRGGAHHFAHHPIERIVADRLLKLPLKGGDGLGLRRPPLLSKCHEPRSRL